MEYRVLGPLEVLDADGQKLPLGGVLQQSVLASLLLRAGQTVALERVVDELWEEPPATAARTVQTYISRLRRELPPGAIESPPGGYRFILNGNPLDIRAFEGLANEGRGALAHGDYGRAARVLAAALRIWRGPALAGLPSEALGREAQRLEELRLQVLEDRFEADLESGRHGEVIPELQALVGEHPFRERLRAQLMLALYRSDRQTEALDAYQQGRDALDELGVEPSDALRRLQAAILRQDEALQPGRDASPAAAPPRPKLSARTSGSGARHLEFVFDLSQAARDGRLDPVIGRREEVEQTIEVLCRRTRNNPVLLGEPGVGKTAIVEEVARWFATGRVPETLAEKRLVVLNLGAMFGMAGAAFGKRLGETVNQIVEARDVMFLDEMHGLVGADAPESEIEAAALLKGPVLKGELQAIIALGLDRSSESALRQDPWFERCFELVLVHEPTARDTIAILRGLRDRYERHHGVRISDDGIVAAVELADRYIVGRARPSKAIDVIDRASARVRLRSDAEAAQPRPEVNAEHVAEVVSREIGIPAETISARS